jgi:putative hydrolase of the HAD superfamily
MTAAPRPDGPRLVCLDLGGVVIRICRTWAEGCAAAGLPMRDPDLWTATAPARRALNDQYQTGRIDGATFASQLSTVVGGLYTPSEIMGIHRAWLLDEYPGVAGLIGRLHQAGFSSAALSNTNHEHWTRIGDYPAVMRMQHLVASHQVGLHKPDPAIYRRLEAITGFTGSQIVFFDDTPENVDAAQAQGWRAGVIDPAASPAHQIETFLADLGVRV